jgi:hypothetical protein
MKSRMMMMNRRQRSSNENSSKLEKVVCEGKRNDGRHGGMTGTDVYMHSIAA